LRFVDGKAVVVGNARDDAGPATGLKPGDAILALDGAPVDRLIDAWKPYYSASNEPCRMDLIVGALTRGACGPVTLRVERSGAQLELSTERRPKPEPGLRSDGFYDLPGPAFRRLSPEVAYLKVSTANEADLENYLRGASGTKGWIIDIRNYPSDSTPWLLGGHFVSESTPFALLTKPDAANPGAFVWGDPAEATPIAPFYPGKVVILVDEVSVSAAEFAAMMFRAAPNAIVVGSTTRAADGNVSYVPLPGGLKSRISGLGVFYPDKRPTQRIGIVPDVEARPSIAGIREGRDEELEAAVRQILGPDAPEAKIREIATP
jgi:C-terminal processing protease CtpA/Prc